MRHVALAQNKGQSLKVPVRSSFTPKESPVRNSSPIKYIYQVRMGDLVLGGSLDQGERDCFSRSDMKMRIRGCLDAVSLKFSPVMRG